MHIKSVEQRDLTIDMLIFLSVNFCPCKIRYQVQILWNHRKATKEGLSTFRFFKLNKKNIWNIFFSIIIKIRHHIDHRVHICLLFVIQVMAWKYLISEIDANLDILKKLRVSRCDRGSKFILLGYFRAFSTSPWEKPCGVATPIARINPIKLGRVLSIL